MRCQSLFYSHLSILRSGEQRNIFEMEMFSDHTVIQCWVPKEFERQVKTSRSGGDFSRYHWVIAVSPQRYKLDDKTYRPAVNASRYQQTRTHTKTQYIASYMASKPVWEHVVRQDEGLRKRHALSPKPRQSELSCAKSSRVEGGGEWRVWSSG